MSPYYIQSLKTYNQKKKPCNNYEKDVAGFCKHCSQLKKNHNSKNNDKHHLDIDSEWILVDKSN